MCLINSHVIGVSTRTSWSNVSYAFAGTPRFFCNLQWFKPFDAEFVDQDSLLSIKVFSLDVAIPVTIAMRSRISQP